jgi:DNA repair protein RecN (Recombination protein N)
MLRRVSLRDFVIVHALEVEFEGGFTVLTGETGAGKSILVDALQLALGSRGEAGVVREGAARCEIGAEFDTPASMTQWLDDAGFERGDTLLLRRTIDAQGKSRAWINGSSATLAQLRDAADRLVDIHGQHAWQSLTRAAAVRALLDAYAGVDAQPLALAWSAWRAALDALDSARAKQADLDRERERLAWQIGEVDKLRPGADEWAELEAEHKKLSNAQSLLAAARAALDLVCEADDNAGAATGRAIDALAGVAGFDRQLSEVADVLRGAQVQIEDAARTLSAYLNHTDLEPQRLQALDERIATWIGLARRFRRRPEELPALLEQWKAELRALEAAGDLQRLELAVSDTRQAYDAQARAVSAARHEAAPRLAQAVTRALQHLGMQGGRFEVDLVGAPAPQSYGLEAAELRVSGHAGTTPRPLAKVASGGELSRIALCVAVTTSQLGEAGTLIFDEIDAGVGGAVAETVGRLMKQLGRDRQVLAVTHLPQVAACADHHFVVAKTAQAQGVRSSVEPVTGEARVAEVARMLGGERLSGTSLAHAQEMIAGAATPPPPADAPPRKPAAPPRAVPKRSRP